MTRILTPEEIKIIDAAEAVLRSLCVGPVSSVSLAAYQGCGGFVGSAANGDHLSYGNETSQSMADGLQTALNKLYADYPGECTLAQRRVAKLEAELNSAREHAAKVCEVTK